MSRFTPINMAALPEFTILKSLSFEDELAALKQRLLRRAEKYDLDLSDVINLETDPLHVIYEAFAEELIKLYGEVNDQIRALILTDAVGAELDHIAATYYGIARLIVTPADPDAEPPTDDVLEDDEDFRARIALAPEAFSTAGSEGGYIFHVLELDGIADISDVAPYSEDDNATYTDGLHADAHTVGLRAMPFANRATGDPVLAPEVLIVILPKEAYGAADQALLTRAFHAVSRKDVRPIGDNVRIEPATAFPYLIEAKLFLDAGPSPDVVITEAKSAVMTYVQSRRRIGARVQRIGIAAALKVPGVQEIDLIAPAADILPGSKGYGELSDDPIITAEVLTEGWRP
jgi:phage-related baseplate assembly protein